MYYIVFDIGGTSIKYSLMNEKGEMLTSESENTPEQGNGKTQELLVDIINKYKEKYDLEGVAISVPGELMITDIYILWDKL